MSRLTLSSAEFTTRHFVLLLLLNQNTSLRCFFVWRECALIIKHKATKKNDVDCFAINDVVNVVHNDVDDSVINDVANFVRNYGIIELYFSSITPWRVYHHRRCISSIRRIVYHHDLSCISSSRRLVYHQSAGLHFFHNVQSTHHLRQHTSHRRYIICVANIIQKNTSTRCFFI